MGMLHPHITSDSNPNHQFDEVELKVLKMICAGYSTLEISAELFRSPRTVEGYRANILRKTHVKNSLNLLRYAIKHGIIGLNEL